MQLGGSLASAVASLFRLDPAGIRILLMAGVAAGFGAVFGTPLAGAVFALEVLAIGRIEYAGILTDGVVFFNLRAIVNWHFPAEEIDHFRTSSQMTGV